MKVKSPQSFFRTRNATRLMIVQALYEMEQSHLTPLELERNFFEAPLSHFFTEKGILGDRAYFREIVTGICEKKEEIDGWIAQFLTGNWRLDRLEMIVLAILRAGTYELWAMLDTPAPILINAYVALTHGFFSTREPQFVNAVLDKIAAVVRAPQHETSPSHPSEPLPQESFDALDPENVSEHVSENHSLLSENPEEGEIQSTPLPFSKE